MAFSTISKRLRKKNQNHGEPINVYSEEDLNKIMAENNVVLVDFWAQWCGPCLLMNENIKTMAQKYED